MEEPCWAGKTERVSFKNGFCGSTNPRMTELSHFWDWFMTDWIARPALKLGCFPAQTVSKQTMLDRQPATKIKMNLDHRIAIRVHDRYVRTGESASALMMMMLFLVRRLRHRRCCSGGGWTDWWGIGTNGRLGVRGQSQADWTDEDWRS
jgi:hypothetical protein